MKNFLLIATLLLLGSWGLAQSNTAGQTSLSQTGNAASSDPSEQNMPNAAKGKAQMGDITIRGCLREAKGQYELNDPETGTTYSLLGKQNLAGEVGHDIEIMGRPTGTSGHAAGSKKDTTVGQSASDNPFEVHSLRERGKCNSRNLK